DADRLLANIAPPECKGLTRPEARVGEDRDERCVSQRSRLRTLLVWLRLEQLAPQALDLPRGQRLGSALPSLRRLPDVAGRVLGNAAPRGRPLEDPAEKSQSFSRRLSWYALGEHVG